MNTSIITIDEIDFPVIVYKDLRVVTTELLAKAFGTEDARIRKNLSRNKDRFVEGKHFYKVVGEELKEFASVFKTLTNFSMVRSLILWTDRGAARHAKMLETDAAWDVFEKMEDSYFENPKSQAAIIPLQAPRAKISVKGGLELHQQDAINDLINERMLIVPQDRKAAMKIRTYSAINTKFGTKGMKDGYKNIQPEHFDNIISLIARLPLDEALYLTLTEQEFKALSGEVMPKSESIPTDTISLSLNGGTRLVNFLFNGTNDNAPQNYWVQVGKTCMSITTLNNNEKFKTQKEIISDLIEDDFIVLKKAELLGRLEV